MRSYRDIRYRFGPLERRGLIGTLRPGQLLVLGSTVLLTILLVETLRNGAGLALGAMFLSCGGLASFVPFGGRTMSEWVPVVATFASRKLRGRDHWRSGAAEAGTRFLGGDIPVRPPDPIGRVELLSFPFRGVELGVLADRSNGTFTAVLQARARSFVLLDPEDKAQRLAGWAGVIAGLAREGSPISRLQWLERTVPDDRNALNRYLRDALDPEIGLDALPLQSYLRLKQAGGKDTGACMVLARELDTMARRLEQAEVEVLHALGPRRLAATIRLAYDPHARTNLARLASNDPSREDGVSARNAWPQRTQTHWSYYRTNDVVHATYWIAEWPRIEVGPDFMAPLLVQTRCMRTVSVTMEPVPPLKAMRAVGFAKTADVADEELRQKLGFLGTAKRRNQADAVARREQELADGHADVRFSGYITVTADDTDELSASCGEVEHAAGQCRLEIQRCDGEQEVAFTYVLTLDQQRRITAAPIAAKVDVGLDSSCLRVTFASGRSVITTPEHPFLMPDGWRRADQLAVEETAAVPARIPFPEKPVRILDEEVDFLAIILAEGCYVRSQSGGVRFSSADPEIIARMRRAGERLGFSVRHLSRYDWNLTGHAKFTGPQDGTCACGCGAPTPIATRTRNGNVKGQPRQYADGHSSRRGAAATVLRRFGVPRALSREKVLPEVIYRLPPDQLARFIGVFWMCDGTVGQAGVSATLTSERLVRQLQHLVLRFGIQSKVRPHRSTLNGRPFPAWQLRVYSQSDQTFLSEILLWGTKRARLAALCAGRTRGVQAGVGATSLPPAVRARLDAAARLFGGRADTAGFQQVAERLGASYRFQFSHIANFETGRINRPGFRAFCEVFGLMDEYGLLLDSDIFWDRIVSIEDVY